ncbi:MAG: hypothetical protein LBS44_00390 [Deltaproteobacteria bacterium]|jgi:hypothetical protein|nr:hypothetical protein [Deltaproteobacteria bacterium]
MAWLEKNFGSNIKLDKLVYISLTLSCGTSFAFEIQSLSQTLNLGQGLGQGKDSISV